LVLFFKKELLPSLTCFIRDIQEIARLSEYVPVSPPSRAAPGPPVFLLGPANAALLWEIFGDVQTPGAGCHVLRNAFVAPTGFAIVDGKASYGKAFLHPRHHVVTVSDRLNAEKSPVREVAGPLAVIYGPAHETWGHWLTDFMPRLWVLRAAGFDLDALRYVVPPDLRPFAWELLACFGITRERCEVYRYFHEILHTETLLLPTGLRADNRFASCFAAATRWWTGIVRGAAPAVPPTAAKLFLSRAGAPQARQMANRAVIEKLAEDAGYAIVRPESLTLQQQVCRFSEAGVLAGEYGSALHNSVFAAPGTLVCGLRGTSLHPSFVQSGIAQALRQKVGYVFGDTGGQDVAQRFTIAELLFRKAIEIIEEDEEEEGRRKEAVLF
jgi:capsular polysaccharide biosynthesis protein